MRTFDVVVATDLERGIGKAGRLPWKLAADLKHFRKLTSSVTSTKCKNAVIMGRKTWESLPPKFRPLPGRVNVVLTRAAGYALPEGVLKAASLDEALEALEGSDVERCFVIGGGEIYAHAVRHPACRLLYMTEIRARFDCDTFFPDYRGSFVEISASPAQQEEGLEYRFKVLGRKGV